MNLKAVLLSACSLLAISASAQDKIYKKNGDVIDGKVKIVNQKSVSYKRQDNPDGPEYVINRADVEKIKYHNGSEDYMTSGPMKNDREPEHSANAKPQLDYGNNIISAALINLSEYGYGVGIAYERSLDQRGHISFYLPVNVCLGGLGSNNDYYSPTGNYTNRMERTIFQVMPGIKFYPTGNKGKVRYAVAPQLVFEKGTIVREQWVYDPTFPNGFSVQKKVDMQKLGVMINNSVNMFPNPHLMVGVDFGLGIPYSHKEEDFATGVMRERGADAPLVQFNFRIGYRF